MAVLTLFAWFKSGLYIGRVAAGGKHDQVKPSPVMTVAEVAVLLRIHHTTLYRMIRKRQIPVFRVGSDYRFNRQAIDEWQQAQEFHPAPPSSRPRR
jgi:excisionase family DNA binding protein